MLQIANRCLAVSLAPYTLLAESYAMELPIWLTMTWAALPAQDMLSTIEIVAATNSQAGDCNVLLMRLQR